MPTYEYKCGNCGVKHEMRRKIEERNLPHPCPSCRHSCDKLEISTGVSMGGGHGEQEGWLEASATDSEGEGGHMYVGSGGHAEIRNNLFIGGRRGIVSQGKAHIKSGGNVFVGVDKPFVHLP